MAQHNCIRISLERANSVRQRFAFGDGRELHIVDLNDRTAEALHGGCKRRRGARGRLVEKIGEHLAFEQVKRADALHHGAHLLRHFKNCGQISFVKLRHRQDVLAVEAAVALFTKWQMATDGAAAQAAVIFHADLLLGPAKIIRAAARPAGRCRVLPAAARLRMPAARADKHCAHGP